MVMMPPVRHLLAARFASPQQDVCRGGLEHLVVGQMRADGGLWQEKINFVLNHMLCDEKLNPVGG